MNRLLFCLSGGLLLLAVFAMTSGAQAAGNRAALTGEQIFRRKCASCHGAKGEGTKQRPQPLTGSHSVSELARLIAKTMPPGPHKCTGEESRKVSAYIYDAFYSPLAQARNSPARIALSRLTVRQFRNAVSELVGSFRNSAKPDERRGLRGEYFKTGHHDGGDRVLERIDSDIRFDYGTAGPTPAQADPYQFAMRWDGSVLAPDTGVYEFVVRTEHAVRLWINDLRQPFIDAAVKSGNDNEYRGTLFLLGGHAYPLRLEFSKGVQGVDNLAEVKKKPPTKASITLAWRQPRQAEEAIPARCLFPVSLPETFVPSAPFPPDDRSIGYERGTSVSKAWDEATTSAALETAGYVTAHLRELSGVKDDTADRPAKLQAFCRQFVERAFRRSLSEETGKFYVARQFQSAPDLEAAVKRVVLLTLKSPRFLYREISTGADPYDVASRLSFGLWDSLPDAQLLKAASAGELSTREQVTRQAERMSADPRAWFKLRDFLLQWLKVDQATSLVKDSKKFPGFDAAAASDLRTSLDLFLESVAWSEKSDYRELLLTDRLFLNGRLAKLYGANLAPDAPFQAVSLDANERAGVLTQPYLLANFAYLDTSSPIHRGVLIMRNMLGRTLQPPPAAFSPLPADLHPDLTTRQRVAMQTRPAACMGCHGRINPLGFTLERFDAIGRLRDRENGHVIETTGSYQTRAGQTVQFAGARDLARYLAGSDEAHAAFVEKLFQYLVKQPVLAYGPRTLPDLQRAFEANQCSIRKTMIEIMAASALTRYNNGSLPDNGKGVSSDQSKHPTRISPKPGPQRRDSAVRNQSAVPGRSRRTSQAAADRDVQPGRRRAVHLLAGRGGRGVYAQGEPETAGAVQE